MEYLVHIDINWPPDSDEDYRQEIYAAELARGKELAAQGLLRRIWRIPGRWANWSLYEVANATELHTALSSLPLFPWMDITVHSLARHDNDPRASAPGGGSPSTVAVDPAPASGQDYQPESFLRSPE